MLYQFTVGNFRSFYKKKTFTLNAQGLAEEPKSNITIDCNKKILKTAALYGANSSGKTNFVRAIQLMGITVLRSIMLNPSDKLYYEPFLLNKTGDKEPTFFEIVFSYNNTIYRYGFSYNLSSIVEEWLFKVLKTRDEYLFVRNPEGVGVNDKSFEEGVDKESQVNDNRLFLSLCAQLGGKISKDVISWFENDIDVISGLSDWQYEEQTKNIFHKHEPLSENLLDFYKKMQLGFVGLDTREDKVTYFSGRAEERTTTKVFVDSMHNVYGKNGEIVGKRPFQFNYMESSGTMKLFNLSGVLFEALKEGHILVVDEMDAAMHPLISQQLIMLFNNPTTNPNNAQLIFNTHDTHLLSSGLLRRDQIWFTEKDHKEETDLYNMMDIVLPDGTKPRNDANYEKSYIAGRYGAIPYIMND